MEISKGYYKHFKGNFYLVENVAIHSETGDKVVVYRADYGERSLFVRPLNMFLEEVEFNGRKVPRFRPLTKQELADHLSDASGRLFKALAQAFVGDNDD
jgi:hypothetical protein